VVTIVAELGAVRFSAVAAVAVGAVPGMIVVVIIVVGAIVVLLSINADCSCDGRGGNVGDDDNGGRKLRDWDMVLSSG